MAKYTTGELAALCGVSVRTVQYYDTRGILIPGELSEGGRRIYTDADLDKMRMICFLRELDLPIESIKQLLEEDEPERVVSLILDERQALLDSELRLLQERADRLSDLRQTLKKAKHFSLEAIVDYAKLAERKKKLWRLRAIMLCTGLVMDAAEIGVLVWWHLGGSWIPFAVGLPIIIALGVGISALYFNSVAYLCPECHRIFRPKLRDMLWARHTPNTRRLHCPHCKHFGFCVETYQKKEEICFEARIRQEKA